MFEGIPWEGWPETIDEANALFDRIEQVGGLGQLSQWGLLLALLNETEPNELRNQTLVLSLIVDPQDLKSARKDFIREVFGGQ